MYVIYVGKFNTVCAKSCLKEMFIYVVPLHFLRFTLTATQEAISMLRVIEHDLALSGELHKRKNILVLLPPLVHKFSLNQMS